ncbi:14759_t:CDS:2 [Dentiscutata erythropus]|uniref:14759_t:CDS:1 n=1 Tax=Dentiscutata erythropus TaxID=1348616 RepID=A0A9N9IV67_9GLOM|nr:14759_t:CDS:2 [Dentiscutata erythropus]
MSSEQFGFLSRSRPQGKTSPTLSLIATCDARLTVQVITGYLPAITTEESWFR